MNMMSVLLGATSLLLVAALVLSFGSMNENVGSDPTKKEIAALRADLDVLRAAEAELRFRRQRNASVGTMATAPYAVRPVVLAPIPNPVDAANQEAELAAARQEAADAKAEAERQKKRAETLDEEASLAWQQKIESNNADQKQARLISQALQMATVTEWSPDDGFLVIDINMPQAVQKGTVLAIRRNTGIIGRIKVDEIYPEGASADPLPGSFFGDTMDIQAGDVLILPPD